MTSIANSYKKYFAHVNLGVTSRNLEALQAGRGIAALAVLAFHLSIMMGDPRYGGQEILASYTWRGNLGVDFFFVLSGFIIIHAHFKDVGKPRHWMRYAWNRWSRVYPIYWIYNAVMVGLLIAFPADRKHLPIGLASWFSDIFLIRLSSAAPLISPAWTLFHEVIFYVLFSVLIVGPRIGIFVLSAWLLTCCIFYHLPCEQCRTAWNVYTSGYNINFFLGIFTFLAIRQGWARNWMLVVGIIFLVGAIVADSRFVSLPAPVYALTFGVIISGAVAMETNGLLKVPRIFALLGNASYSIYLLHENLCGIVLKGMMRAHARNLLTGEGVYLVTLLLAVSGGVIAYLFLEQPLLQRIRGTATTRPSLTAFRRVGR